MMSLWKRPIMSAVVVAAVLSALVGCARHRVPGAFPLAPVTASPVVIPVVPSATPPVDKPKSVFNKTQYSLVDPTSIWVVVDKLRPVQPISYAPQLVTLAVPHISAPLMTQEAGDALLTMFTASISDGGGALQIQNSYRSYAVQTHTHNSLVDSIGEVKADAQSARAGYSEHQTGLTVDIAALPSKCDIAACFGQTPQGIWLAANAWKYGYLLRYPADKTAITGYIYEPWHFRYVGVALSTEMHNDGIETMEEFFTLAPAPDYLN